RTEPYRPDGGNHMGSPPDGRHRCVETTRPFVGVDTQVGALSHFDPGPDCRLDDDSKARRNAARQGRGYLDASLGRVTHLPGVGRYYDEGQEEQTDRSAAREDQCGERG